MIRNALILGTLGILLPSVIDRAPRAEAAAPPVRGGQAGAACPELDEATPDNPTWAWRLRAYRYLDCVTSIVDNALGTAKNAPVAGSDSADTVSIARAELERIRLLAWWARDAAGRSGQ
jgi:hypothetical protein